MLVRRLLNVARVAVAGVALLVLACTTAPSGTQARPAAQIKIGAIVPLTGPVSSFGASVKAGVQFAVDEWNARGGIGGSRIVTVFEDGQCSAEPSVAAIRKLIDVEHVHYVIGEVCSGASIPVSVIANAAGVVQITPTSTNPAVTVESNGHTRPFVFRACFVDPWQGTVGARFAFQNLGARRAYILRDPSNAYASSLADTFTETFKALGGSIVGSDQYKPDDQDFSDLLAGVKSQAPDIIYLPDYYNIVNIVMPQARSMGIQAPFLGGDGWDSSDLDAKADDGGYFTNHYAADDPRPAARAFVEAWKASGMEPADQNGAPDALAALAYDAAQMLFQSIRAVGKDDPALVRAALESLQFSGVTGNITFDRQHNPRKTAVVMGVHRDGVRFETSMEP
jgi:branched-chain amino acid transport system substrate-binding protein